MDASLVTARSFWNVLEAHIARAKVESAGIACVLADENTVGMDWVLGNAIGGVKLQVRQADLGRALEVLAEKRAGDAFAGEGMEAEAFAARSPREEAALHALHTAMVGCLFFPISFYALFLCAKAVGGEGALDAKGGWRLAWAFGLSFLTLAAAAVFAGLIWSASRH